MWYLCHICMEIANEISTLLICPKLSLHLVCCQDVLSFLGILSLVVRALFPDSVSLIGARNLSVSLSHLCEAVHGLFN